MCREASHGGLNDLKNFSVRIVLSNRLTTSTEGNCEGQQNQRMVHHNELLASLFRNDTNG